MKAFIWLFGLYLITTISSLYLCMSVFIIDHRKQPSTLDGNIRNGNKQRVEIIIASRVLDKFPLINAKKRTEAPTYRRAAEYPRTHTHIYISCILDVYVYTYATAASLEASARMRAAATRSLIIF